MINYNSQVTEGNYRIQFETDDKKSYQKVQNLIRNLIDQDEDADADAEEEVIEIKLNFTKEELSRIVKFMGFQLFEDTEELIKKRKMELDAVQLDEDLTKLFSKLCEHDIRLKFGEIIRKGV